MQRRRPAWAAPFSFRLEGHRHRLWPQKRYRRCRCEPNFPAAALAVATSAPVDAFGLTDWGHITPSRRAELLLVEGDLPSDSTATSACIGVWGHDHRVDRDAD